MRQINIPCQYTISLITKIYAHVKVAILILRCLGMKVINIYDGLKLCNNRNRWRQKKKGTNIMINTFNINGR